MPSLTYVTITGDFLGGDGTPLSGTATFTPSQSVYSAGQEIVTPDVPIAGQITDGRLLSESGGALQLLATDQAGLTYLTLTGFFWWTVQVTVGGLTEPAWSFGLPSSPSTTDLFARANMPFSSGGNAVASVFTRTGAVVAANGDYSVGQVTGAAPLASPAFTGTPTAPTQTAANNSTRLATTAYADAAVGVETSRASTAEGIIASAVTTETTRAEAAEALALPKAGGTMSGPIAMGGSKVTGLANGSAAQDAAAFGQIPAALPPNGSAGGVLSGSYPNPGFATTPLPESGGTMTGWLAPKVTALTDAPSTLIDASTGNVFDWPLGAGSHTLAAPSNPVNGQMIKIRIAYSGSFTPLFNAIYHFGTDGQPAWTATNAKVDEVAFEYNSNVSAWCCQGWKLGF